MVELWVNLVPTRTLTPPLTSDGQEVSRSTPHPRGGTSVSHVRPVRDTSGHRISRSTTVLETRGTPEAQPTKTETS